MKRINKYLYIFLMAVLFLTIKVNTRAMDMEASIGTVTIQADPTLKIRSGAGMDYETLGMIPNGTVLETTGMENGWYIIEYQGVQGYVSADYVYFEPFEVEAEEITEDTEPVDDGEEIPEVGEEKSIDFKKLFILVGIALIVFLMIIATIASIKRMDDDYDDDDDDDEEDDDDDEYYDDEYYDDDEEDDEYYDDDEEYEYVVVRKPKQSTQKRRDDDFLIDIDPKYFK